MNRYLIHLSYIGTQFRGIQKNLTKENPTLEDPQSIEGSLEIALKKLHPANDFKIKLSSSHPAFDIETLRRAASSFVGYHDFRTFMTVSRGNQKQHDATYTLRRIHKISVEKGTCMTSAFNRNLADQYYEFWDIRIMGRSFLYKQVRRMVGVWIAAAEGRITERDVQQMLTVPSHRSWCNQAVVAPAYGLYLCQVEYDSADLTFISPNEFSGATEAKEADTATN
ncbi:tRNA pseudouridine synthase-like 1 isoform X2 [Sabethes cyaneus]|uniref:tRNA pseudouridine synthase-like 1 isoform X2 n=1 Tax=Sabethes cyaneus TaxID=53552 RepID=UPI00237EE115|nr:tRNA pseudouridine synthase-like 1 isoform X2 [Sabethes cyaneus]